MEPTSEQELIQLLDEDKITEDEYLQLKEAMQEKQARDENDSKKMSPGEFALRKKMLIYGVSVSFIGLPVGLIMALPYVWGLSIAGIVVGLFKMKKLGIIK